MTIIINGQPAALSRTEIDTISELEAFLGSINLILASEMDSEAKLEALAGAINLLVSTELDTEAELETLLGSVNVILESEIDSEAKVEAIMGVAMATEAEVTSAVGVHAALTQTHGITAAGAALVDDADAAAQLVTLGADAAGTARPPTAHAMAGAEHSVDTLADLNSKISDATLIDTADARLSDARTPTQHEVLGAPHAITGLAQYYFPVAGGAGELVSSASQAAQAQSFASISHVTIASGTGGVYNALARGGLTAGLLVLAPTGTQGAAKVCNENPETATTDVSVGIGTKTADASPLMSLLDVGHYTAAAPTVWIPKYRIMGDGLIEARNVQSEYLPDGGKLVLDTANNRLTTGYQDLADAVVHADWTQVASGGSFGKAAGVTTITVPAGSLKDWVSAGRTSPYLSMELPSGDWDVYVPLTIDAAVADQGGGLAVFVRGDTSQFYRYVLQYNGSYITLAQDSSDVPIYGSAVVGQQYMWLRFMKRGATLYLLESTNAVGSTPTEAQWTLRATEPLDWDMNLDMDVAIFGSSWNTFPGATINSNPLVIKRI